MEKKENKRMKESGKFLAKRRKKLVKGFFLVIICITCGIMYVNRHGQETVIDVAARTAQDPVKEVEAEDGVAGSFAEADGATEAGKDAGAETALQRVAEAGPDVTEDGADVTEAGAAARDDVSDPERDVVAQTTGKQHESPDDGRVNINLAGADELMTLKGIGEKKALSIIEYRTRNGLFTTIEDIMKVPGIKEGTFSKIRDMIKVRERERDG